MNFDGEIKELCIVPENLLNGLLGKLNSKLQEIPSLWMLYDNIKPNKYGVFKDTTEHIVFKFPATPDSHFPSRTWDHWDEWKDVIQPIIDLITPQYGYEKGATMSIMLANLKAGKSIAKHIDGGPPHKVPHKIHVPLITGPKVEFWENDTSYYLPKGFAYEVNNLILHGGHNGENFDRVHLIFTYYEVKDERSV